MNVRLFSSSNKEQLESDLIEFLQNVDLVGVEFSTQIDPRGSESLIQSIVYSVLVIYKLKGVR